MGGIVLVGFSIFLGIPGKIRFDSPYPGQILVTVGAAMLTWSCLQASPKILGIAPAALGILMIVQGVMLDDFLPFVCGVIIFTVALFAPANVRLPRAKKG